MKHLSALAVLILALAVALGGCSLADNNAGASPDSSPGAQAANQPGTPSPGAQGSPAESAQAANATGSAPANSGAAADDLVIPISEVSATAKFYPVEVDGTKLEVIAVQAPDGSIRTAFNTCQVCYDSGRGYYKQEGDVLVCQNCGNRFKMNQVEVQSGGCNPVPIFTENKTVTDDNITISGEYLAQAKAIFANWKTQ